ncbi:MAG: PaaX family transcriptional regulator [Candidatus Dormibacteraceae bacterium]
MSDAPDVAAGLELLARAAAPLAPQRLAMTILGAHGRGGRLVWSGGLVRAMGEFGFSDGAARVALGRLVRRGMLARLREGRFIHYRLTDIGERVMREGDRRIFSFGRTRRSSEVWTVVWQAIPEQHGFARWQLVGRLRFLGFGSLQDGTWVAPHDMKEPIEALLAEVGVAAHSIVLVGRPAQPRDLDVLVRRAWNLDHVARRYETFVTAASPLMGAPAGDLEAFVGRALVTDLFRRFPSEDPELPDDPVGLRPLRERALRIFDELFASLDAPAQRLFDAVTRSPSLLATSATGDP